MIDRDKIQTSSEREQPVETSIGKTEIKIGRRTDGSLALETEGGDGASFDVFRDMSVAKLEENILDSEERGNDTQAQADKDIVNFLTKLSPEAASSESVSMMGLAHNRLQKLQDLMSSDSIDADTKMGLEYKVLVATNAIKMMTAISRSIEKTYTDSTGVINEDEQVSNEARAKAIIVNQHNARVKRNAERRAVSTEGHESPTPSGGLSEGEVQAAKRLLDGLSIGSRKQSAEQSSGDVKTEHESLVPSDWKERNEFAKEFFSGDMNEHPLERNDENKAILRDYLIEEVKMWAKNARDAQVKNGPNVKYAGSMAGVMGIQIGIANTGPQRFAFDVVRFGKNDPGMGYDEYQGIKFKDFAKTYLGIDITEAVPDYDKLFS